MRRIEHMSNTDRRICPFCQKPVATREQAWTNNLVLSKHGGKRKPSGHHMAGMCRYPATKMVGGCEGEDTEVVRIVEVFRAQGVGQSPAYAPTRHYAMDAESDAKWIVREGINSNEEAIWQRFDIPTQSWVTIGRVKPRE